MESSFKSESQLLAPATTSPFPLPSAAAKSPENWEVVTMADVKFYQRRNKEIKKEKQHVVAQKNWVPETPVKPVPVRPQIVYTKRSAKCNSGPSFLSRISKEEAEADRDMAVMASVSEKEEKEDKARSLNFSCLSSSTEVVSIDLNKSICDTEDAAGVSVCGSSEDGGSGNSLLESNNATECDREKDLQGDCSLKLETKKLHPVQQLEPATPLIKHKKRQSSGGDPNPRPAKKKKHRPKVVVDGVSRRPAKILCVKTEKMERVRKAQSKGKKEKKNQCVKRLKTTVENHVEITTGDHGSDEILLTILELPSIHSTQHNLTAMSDLKIDSCGHKEELTFPTLCKRRRMKRKKKSRVSVILLNFFLLKGHRKKKRSTKKRLKRFMPREKMDCEDHLLGETLTAEKGIDEESVSNPSKQSSIREEQGEQQEIKILNPLEAQNHEKSVPQNVFEMRPRPAYPELQEESLHKESWFKLTDKSTVGTQKAFNHEDIIMKKGAIVPYPGSLSIKEGDIVPTQGSLSPEESALVPHRGVLSPEKGAVVLHCGPRSTKKIKPKIEIDPETMRQWIQIKRIEDGLCEEEEDVDEETKRKWEEDRKVFKGRLDAFNEKMFLALGNREFKPWIATVMDSVGGVFLTQNVSDMLSSSAYMSLAAKFPNKKRIQEELHCSQESAGSTNGTAKDSPGPQYSVTTYDEEGLSDIEDFGKPIWMETTNPLPSSVTLNGLETSSSRMHPPNFHDFYQACCSSSRACHGSDNYETTVGSQAEIVVQKALPDASALPQDCCLQTEVGIGKNLGSKCLGSECCSQAEAGTQKGVDSLDLQHDEKLKVDEVVPHGALNPTDNVSSTDPASKEARTTTARKKIVDRKKEVQKKDWDRVRRKYSQPRSSNHTDTIDWEAVRQADVNVIAETIKARGQHTIIAARIKALLDRVVELHGSIDLEWLRHAPPMGVKEYLLDVEGLGLKSVECIRLLELGHVAFPVDTNVTRIAARLNWVPLKALPGDLQFHLLEEYPMMDAVQQYLWPRLRKFDHPTLYKFHYNLITFGKIFCKKRNPNCNACPMRAECKHYASAVAARLNLNLPGPTKKDSETSIVPSMPVTDSPSMPVTDSHFLSNNAEISVTLLESGVLSETGLDEDSGVTSEPGLENSGCVPLIEEPKSPELVQNIKGSGESEDDCVPLIEEPKSPELVQNIKDSGEREDDCDDNDVYDNKFIDNKEEEEEEIPTIILNNEEFRKNVQYFMEKYGNHLEGGYSSRDLVPLSVDVNSSSAPKLKHVKHLRTEHLVYQIPDGHDILRGIERRDPADSVPYLLAIWSAGETTNSVEQPKKKCNSQGSELCTDATCFACQSVCEGEADIVRGTILIPCRTAMRGRFPLNGTYFQVNEVFADHETSCKPLIVPRKLIWGLDRRIVFFGTSASSIFTSECSLLEIQTNFWIGFTCMRGFNRETREPKPLARRFHCSPSKMEKTPRKVNPNKKKTTPKEKGNDDAMQASRSEGATAI